LRTYKITYKQFGNSALLIEWPQEISIDILNDIKVFYEILQSQNYAEIEEINFVYASLMIVYRVEKIAFKELTQKLIKLYNTIDSSVHKFKKNIWEIPVCYHQDFGIDLPEISALKSLSADEIRSLHSTNSYTVFGIGFLPGFLYLGGLAKELHLPRKNTPRMSVPKGAVAIGGSQTGIYPQESPGGWHIIGSSPIHMFDANREFPCEIKSGDEVRFYAVSKKTYQILKNEQERGIYKLKSLTK